MAASRLAAFLVIGVVTACSGSVASPSPSANPSPTQSPAATPTTAATAAATPASTATPSPRPTTAPTPSPSAAPPGTGLGWTSVEVPQIGEGCCWGIASADAGFLILAGTTDAGAPLLITSSDGISWTALDDLVWPGGTMDLITGWNGQFLAVGVSGPDDSPHAAFWTSDTGHAWVALPDAPELTFLNRSVAGAIGQSDVAMIDVEGDQIDAVGNSYAGCGIGEGGCDGPVAVIEWKSTDGGGSWTRHSLARDLENHYPPIKVGDRWVRVSQYWDSLEGSVDRKHWDTAWTPPTGYFGPTKVRLTTLGAIAVGYLGDYEAGAIVVSTDGTTWTQSVGWPDLDVAEQINDVAQSETTLVAVGSRIVLGRAQPYVLVSPPLN